MMISRRPNRRKSRENAPGPSSATATPRTTTTPAPNGPLRTLSNGSGTRNANKAAETAPAAPAREVYKPRATKAPDTIRRPPKACEASDEIPVAQRIPTMIAVIPSTDLSSSSATPEPPQGKLENSCRSLGLLSVSAVIGATHFSVAALSANEIPDNWNLFVTLLGDQNADSSTKYHIRVLSCWF